VAGGVWTSSGLGLSGSIFIARAPVVGWPSRLTSAGRLLAVLFRPECTYAMRRRRDIGWRFFNPRIRLWQTKRFIGRS